MCPDYDQWVEDEAAQQRREQDAARRARFAEMPEKDLTAADLIGKRADWVPSVSSPETVVYVTITNYREAYGHKLCEITPLCGQGKLSVRLHSLRNIREDK
jgi:hypothetical protein